MGLTVIGSTVVGLVMATADRLPALAIAGMARIAITQAFRGKNKYWVWGPLMSVALDGPEEQVPWVSAQLTRTLFPLQRAMGLEMWMPPVDAGIGNGPDNTVARSRERRLLLVLIAAIIVSLCAGRFSVPVHRPSRLTVWANMAATSLIIVPSLF